MQENGATVLQKLQECRAVSQGSLMLQDMPA